MRSNLHILRKYGHILLFLFYEMIAFVLIVNYNVKQKEIFLHSSSLFFGAVSKKSAEVGDYLSLRQSNDELLRENARLLKDLIRIPRILQEELDTSRYPYEVIPARVINNSIQTTHNYFTIDKGSNDRVATNMGVITSDGVAGIVTQVSTHYATVLSLLHINSRISASIKEEDYFGTIFWDGKAFDRLSLKGIPKHIKLQNGLIVETNGYSTIFPRGITIGTIRAFNISKNGVFYDISIEPVTDFTKLGHVYVLKNNFAKERLDIESDE